MIPESGHTVCRSLLTVSSNVSFQERKVAVDSLRSVAGLLSEAYGPLHEAVFGRTDIPDDHTLDTFFSTVKATADVRERPHLNSPSLGPCMHRLEFGFLTVAAKLLLNHTMQTAPGGVDVLV